MTDEGAKLISDALLKIAESITYMGDSITSEEPLSYTLGRALHEIGRAINNFPSTDNEEGLRWIAESIDEFTKAYKEKK